jgi:hypothetical protein
MLREQPKRRFLSERPVSGAASSTRNGEDGRRADYLPTLPFMSVSHHPNRRFRDWVFTLVVRPRRMIHGARRTNMARGLRSGRELAVRVRRPVRTIGALY